MLSYFDVPGSKFGVNAVLDLDTGMLISDDPFLLGTSPIEFCQSKICFRVDNEVLPSGNLT